MPRPRSLSRAAVMQSIVHDAPVSRARIARETGLSKPTVSEIVAGLEREGWVRATGRTSGHVGRSATTWETVAAAAGVAVVDLGGTRIRAAITDLAGAVRAEVAEPTDPDGGIAVVRQTARLCRLAAERHGFDVGRLRLAVIGVAGVPHQASGAVPLSPNIGGLEALDFRATLAAALAVPVCLENDVNLAVLGEHWLGGGAGDANLAFIAIGTGIGAGLMVGGQLVRGSAGAGGEIGFLPIGADPYEAESLRIGALERVVGTAGIRRRYREQSGRDAAVPDIFAAAADGDRHADAVLGETARYLAWAITAIAATTNPDRVILGGSIGERPELARRIRSLLPPRAPIAVAVETSRIGRSAALHGGGALGFEQLHRMLFADGHAGARITPPRRGWPVRG